VRMPLSNQHGPLSGEDKAVLRRATLFYGFSEAALGTMLAGSALRTARRGTILFVQDEPADRFYLVLEGWVKLYRTTAAGVVSVIHVVAPGETFAEAAMFASGRFPVTAEAASDCRLLAINRTAFTRVLRSDPDAVMAMLASLSIRLRSQVREIEQLQVQTTAQRAAAFLLSLCPSGAKRVSFELPFEKGLIARRLGMKPETLSRALSKLRGIGVETDGATVAVGSVKALREFCGAPGDLDG
jgi:CRP/FNR family transcriptional regulator, dissimilatory nitrate respiration regulator